jgi:LEA14-like dessication related protein
MKKLIIIALVVVSAVAGAATLNNNPVKEIQIKKMPAQEMPTAGNSKELATWD